MTAKPRMNVVVIGCGSMGHRRAELARQLGHRVFLADTRPIDATLRVKSRLTGGGDVSNLLNTGGWHEHDFDAFFVCTPAETHLHVVDAVLGYWPDDRRIGVFIEKPAFHTTRAFGALHRRRPLSDDKLMRLSAAPQDNVLTLVGYNWRFHEDVLAFRRRHISRWTDNARVAEVSEAKLWVRCDSSTWPGRNYGHGVLECSHEIDLALWLFGGGTVRHIDRLRADGHAYRIVVTRDGERGNGERAVTEVTIDDRSPCYSRGLEVVYADGVRDGWSCTDTPTDLKKVERSYSAETASALTCVERHIRRRRPLNNSHSVARESAFRVVEICEAVIEDQLLRLQEGGGARGRTFRDSTA